MAKKENTDKYLFISFIAIWYENIQNIQHLLLIKVEPVAVIEGFKTKSQRSLCCFRCFFFNFTNCIVLTRHYIFSKPFSMEIKAPEKKSQGKSTQKNCTFNF